MATSQVLEGMIISSSGEAGEIVVRAQERPSSFKSKSCVSVEWWSGASAWEIGMRTSSTPSLSAEMTMMAERGEVEVLRPSGLTLSYVLFLSGVMLTQFTPSPASFTALAVQVQFTAVMVR